LKYFLEINFKFKRRTIMRKIALLLLSAVAIHAHAAEYTATGLVQKIFALDKIAYGVDKSHILIAGLSVAGSCPTNDGLVALVLRDDDGGRRQLSVALSAKLTNRSVVIRVEDVLKNAGGQCYLKYLELN
jgi:hypothetical protein